MEAQNSIKEFKEAKEIMQNEFKLLIKKMVEEVLKLSDKSYLGARSSKRILKRLSDAAGAIEE